MLLIACEKDEFEPVEDGASGGDVQHRVGQLEGEIHILPQEMEKPGRDEEDGIPITGLGKVRGKFQRTDTTQSPEIDGIDNIIKDDRIRDGVDHEDDDDGEDNNVKRSSQEKN